MGAGKPLVRGIARCTWAEALEDILSEGELYYIREIPNMRGHVVVLKTGEPPIVGIHLERFELVNGAFSEEQR